MFQTHSSLRFTMAILIRLHGLFTNCRSFAGQCSIDDCNLVIVFCPLLTRSLFHVPLPIHNGSPKAWNRDSKTTISVGLIFLTIRNWTKPKFPSRECVPSLRSVLRCCSAGLDAGDVQQQIELFQMPPTTGRKFALHDGDVDRLTSILSGAPDITHKAPNLWLRKVCTKRKRIRIFSLLNLTALEISSPEAEPCIYSSGIIGTLLA
jgi:hypothetical protein